VFLSPARKQDMRQKYVICSTGHKGELLYSKNDNSSTYQKHCAGNLFSKHVTSCLENAASTVYAFRMHILASENSSCVIYKLGQEVL
jgi:hypothetical protein